MVSRTLYAGALAVSLLCSLGVALAVLTRRDGASRALAGLLGAGAAWCGVLLCEMLVGSAGAKLAVHRVEQVTVAAAATALFVFALRYTGRGDLLPRHRLPLLAVEPAAVLALAVAYPGTTLLWTGGTVTPLGVMEMAEGPAFWVHVGYTYALALGGLYVLLRRARGAANVGETTVAAFSVAFLLPVAAGVVDAFDLLPAAVTPVAFVVTALSLYAGTAGGAAVARTPVVRDVIVDAIDEPIVVTADGEVVDTNEAFRQWFGATDPVGEPLAAVLAGRGPLCEHVLEGIEGVLEVDAAAGRRTVEVQVSPVRDRGTEVARLALLHDVTERQRQRRELERQNERLEEFASLISHDLRNPLDVAMGRTNVLVERVEDPSVTDHLEVVADAHDRMRRIIDDVLTLARQGRSIDEREPVDLADLAAEAWSHVDTGEATLEVTVDRTVGADRDRLARVFENLFRNAVQHGGPAVTVTVGGLADGFYVADDGTGIPPEDYEQVLEAGYTDHEDGTGLGLSIVRSVVEAHGWELSLGAAEGGGARFEVTGTDRHEPETALAGSRNG